MWVVSVLYHPHTVTNRITVQMHAHVIQHQQSVGVAAPRVVEQPPLYAAAPNSMSSSHGHRTVGDTSVMFGMIGRDVADELPYVLANIARLASHFQEAHVMFVENNSHDNTRGVFQSWAENFTAGRSNRTAKLLNFKPSSTSKKALKVLAQARNSYLEQLALPHYAGVDYLIAVDTDMCFAWDVPNMVKTINDLLPVAGSGWHALFANGACGWYASGANNSVEEVPFYTPGSTPVYCDLFALVDSSGVRHTMQSSRVSFVPGSCDFSVMQVHSAASMRCTYLAGHAVVPVQAAFGGWGMYRAQMLRPAGKQQACRHDEKAAGECEHVSLSRCLVRQFNATQLIATGLVVNWEGCSKKQQHRWDGWYPGRGPIEV
ncbi:hypothetical protein COO60DRAFT_505510 [Scenedesmus sp. NREL 46B-D3]|nr:hypothetical protein COO60DRAFT_505510 [Scenedesmus sp. NREL 46B-D3]